MNITIEPTRQHVLAWIEAFIPPQDLFFIEEKELAFFESELTDVLVVPKGEFMAHAEYKRLQFANSYLYWNIGERITHVIVAQPKWIEHMDMYKKQELLKIQAGSGRGLVFPLRMLPEAPKDFLVEVNSEALVVMQRHWWQNLPAPVKERFLKEYALHWDSSESFSLPDGAPPHLSAFTNRYSSCHGSNCLSATLFAVTGHTWIAAEWVHPETFAASIQRAKYLPVDVKPVLGDIVVWSNPQGTIQHASYCLGQDLYFNKSGQTFFNPWKVEERDKLFRDWAHLENQVYSAR